MFRGDPGMVESKNLRTSPHRGTGNHQETLMKRLTTATSHHSGWLSLFCISLLLSSFIALPILEDLTGWRQTESGQSQRLVQTNTRN